MNLWPEKSFTIRTQLSPEEAMERVRSLIEAPRKHDDIYIPFFTHPKKRDYIGVITENKFRIFVDQNSVASAKLYERLKKHHLHSYSLEQKKKDIISLSDFVEGKIELQNNLTIIHFSFRVNFYKKYSFIPILLILFTIVPVSLLKGNTTLAITISLFFTFIIILFFAMHKIENIKMKNFFIQFFD